jgi:biopolymer transport protein ExbB/TolQ
MNWRVVLAEHAAERMATAVHREMARGLFGLATVAATAPFVGVLGTLLGIFDSFKGGGGEKTAIMAALAENLSEAMIPTAFGVAVAVAALAGYEYLTVQMADLDADMRGAILAMPSQLAGFVRR